MTHYHHVRSVTGVTLGAKLAAIERSLDRSCRHWSGTPAEFRAWAEISMAQSMRAICSRACCETPDELVGSAIADARKDGES